MVDRRVSSLDLGKLLSGDALAGTDPTVLSDVMVVKNPELHRKGSWMGSEDYGAGGMPGEENSSLAARRARLRGTLSKGAAPPDPYTPDPYMMAPSPPAPDPPVHSQPAQPTVQVHEESGNGKNGSSSSLAAAPAPAPPDAVAPMEDNMANNTPVQDPAETETETPRPDRRKQHIIGSSMPPAVMQNLSNAISTSVASNGTNSMINYSDDESTGSTNGEEQPVSAMPPAPQAYMSMPLAPPTPPASSPAVMPPSPFAPLSTPATTETSELSSATEELFSNVSAYAGLGAGSYAFGLESPPEAAPAPTPPPTPAVQPTISPAVSAVAAPAVMPPVEAPTPAIQSQAFEVLTNIDQAMGACAMNLSELQKIAGEQTEALRSLAGTLQNQSFFEIGLNLNSLMESLSAALEPMKAVGELVPAIDQFVAVMETREAQQAAEEPKLTREQLAINLADQLAAGIIDPWTFKCAYIAVYPSDHPADLLVKLVDLLGTQRLSGELFRAAYDAVQAADPVKPAGGGGEGEVRTVVKVVQDETMLAQIEALQAANEEFRSQQGDVQKAVAQKEEEFQNHIKAKEKELQEAQDLLNSRYEEFNSRYDELTETLHKRDEALAEKDSDVNRKESENSQLRQQIQELRDQMREMADLLSSRPKEPEPQPMQQPQPQPAPAPAPPPPKPAGFFDQAPQQPQQTMFDPNRAPAPAMNPMDQLQQSLPQQPQGMAPQQMAPQGAPQAPQQSNQAVPKPPAPTTPFAGAAGSYGSGVRAQVFEVIVRQALAGAPWREICAGPMQVNNISPEEVEAEVKRRQAMLKK